MLAWTYSPLDWGHFGDRNYIVLMYTYTLSLSFRDWGMVGIQEIAVGGVKV